MFSQRRPGFGRVHRAKIDFHGTRSQPGDTNTGAVEFVFVIGNGKPGPSPVLARSRQIAHGDDDSLNANDAHDVNLGPNGIVTHPPMPPGAD